MRRERRDSSVRTSLLHQYHHERRSTSSTGRNYLGKCFQSLSSLQYPGQFCLRINSIVQEMRYPFSEERPVRDHKLQVRRQKVFSVSHQCAQLFVRMYAHTILQSTERINRLLGNVGDEINDSDKIIWISPASSRIFKRLHELNQGRAYGQLCSHDMK